MTRRDLSPLEIGFAIEMVLQGMDPDAVALGFSCSKQFLRMEMAAAVIVDEEWNIRKPDLGLHYKAQADILGESKHH